MCDPFTLMAAAVLGSTAVSAIGGAKARKEQSAAQAKLEAQRAREARAAKREAADEALASGLELREERARKYATGTAMMNARNLMGSTAAGAFGPRTFFSRT